MWFMSAWFYITTTYGILILLCYACLMGALEMHKKKFKGSFFTLFKIQGLLNILTYANSMMTIRLPQYSCHECSMNSFFEAGGFWGLQGLHTFHFHMAFVQYIFSLVITLNRLTAILYPMTFDGVWKRQMLVIVIVVFLLPLSITWLILFGTSRYTYSPTNDYYLTTSSADINFVRIFLVITMISCTLANLIINGIAGRVIYGIRKKDQNMTSHSHIEWKLVYYTFGIAIVEIFGTCVSVIVEIKDGGFWKNAAQLLIPFFSDGLTLTPPIFIFILSKNVRELTIKTLLRQKDIKKTARRDQFELA